MKLLRNNKLFLLGLVFLSLSVFLYEYYCHPSKKKAINSFQKAFDKQTLALKSEVDDFIANTKLSPDAISAWKSHQIDFRYAKDYYLYYNDSLIFWTNNGTPISNNLVHKNGTSIVQLENGWYCRYQAQKAQYTVVGYFLIKNVFPYENENLKNGFANDLSLRFDATISLQKKSAFVVKDLQGKYLFSLVPTNNSNAGKTQQLIIFISFLLGLCLLLFGLFSKLFALIKSSILFLLVSFVGLVIFPWLIFHYEWLSIFSPFELFQPQLYASIKILPTLGSLFVCIALFGTFCALLVTHIQLSTPKNSFWEKLSPFVFPIAYFVCAFVLGNMLRSLVEDSSVPLFVHDLLNSNVYSYLVIFFLFLLFLSFFVLSLYLINASFSNFSAKTNIIGWFAYSLAFLLIILSWSELFWVIGLFPIVLAFLVLWVKTKRSNQFSFSNSLLIIALFVGFTELVFYHYLVVKEHKTREVFAKKLITDQDLSTEVEYKQLSKKIEHSTYLTNLISLNKNYNVATLKDTLKKQFFNGFWERYEVDFYLYNADSLSLVNYAASNKGNFDYFSKIIANHTVQSKISPSLFYVKNYQDKMSYLIRQKIYLNNKICGFLVCSLKSKKIPREIGFPRLLISNKAKVFLQLENYSTAKYIGNNLAIRYGEFNYPLRFSAFIKEIGKTSGFVEYRGQSHYILKGDNRVVVLTNPLLTASNYLTTFSFLFVSFGLYLIVFLVLSKPKTIHVQQLNLAFKIQLILITLVFFTLLFFSWGASSFISTQYNNYTTRLIREKINSVSKNLQQQNGFEQELKAQTASNYLDFILQKLSTVFYTDINIYTTDGKLLSSSRPAVYNYGLLSRHIDPWAMRMLKYRNKSEIIHQEKIGKLKYLSAYIPFLSKNKEPLCYLNLQYFAHQSQLEQELSSFLTAIINVFILLLAFTVVITIFVTNWITSPLKLIQKSVTSFTLGEKYKPIDYSGKDEIGSLVSEYNKKILELEKTAQELAKTERESAWREMAKQVAHEIKNPLTPMKLSLQQLQRSFDAKSPDATEKLNRTANAIIEQIEALAKIANEFSSFAKLPQPKEAHLDLIPLIKNIIAVFTDKDPRTTIAFHSELKNCTVYADKDLMIRVFNNLIKNALQAIPENQKGAINVSIQEKGEQYVIAIQDNGTGIADEMMDKIFVPNFTTKSTGTGLGLAMVKQIIETHKGTIRFETKKTFGTTFYITLAKV